MKRRIVLVAVVALAGAALAPLALPRPAATILHGVVGPGATITLTNAAGNVVRQVPKGEYTILVDDRSAEHNFHLQGPGVNRATSVDAVETATWDLTLTDGVYRFFCDPHAFSMRGTLTVGTPPPPPVRLVATVGATSVSLRTASGGAVRGLKAGRYVITVRDRSRRQNFHLRGPGVSRKTTLAFAGTVTWTLRLVRGRYTYGSDALRARTTFSVAG